MFFVAEPVQNVLIQPDGDTVLPADTGTTAPRLPTLDGAGHFRAHTAQERLRRVCVTKNWESAFALKRELCRAVHMSSSDVASPNTCGALSRPCTKLR